jgi:hypothetical protein
MVISGDYTLVCCLRRDCHGNALAGRGTCCRTLRCCRRAIVRTGNRQRVERANRHPDAVFERLTLLLTVLRAAPRDRSELLTENQLLRH